RRYARGPARRPGVPRDDVAELAAAVEPPHGRAGHGWGHRRRRARGLLLGLWRCRRGAGGKKAPGGADVGAVAERTQAMTIAIACLLAAALLPYLTIAA